MLKNVVLPAPFGPMRLTIEPCGIVKSTSLTAVRPPNSLRTSLAVRRSVIGRVPVGVGAPELHVVERRGSGARLGVERLRGSEARRAEEHHEHDDQPVDAEVVLRHVLDPELGADLRETL